MKTKTVLLLLVLTANLRAEIHIYGLLKEFFYGSYMTFYNKDYGYVDCHILGIITIDSAKNDKCEIDKHTFGIMQLESRLYARELLYDEQKYKIIVHKNGCILQAGAKIYNEKLLLDGYAVLRKDYLELTKEESNYLKKLKLIQDKAKAQRRGFWKEFNKEMKCLSTN